jgi:hypothetical protein
MRISVDESRYKSPFSVVLLDATDAYYYAEIMDPFARTIFRLQ